MTAFITASKGTMSSDQPRIDKIREEINASHREQCEFGMQGGCGPERRHGECVDCGQRTVTSLRTMRVQEGSLKRQLVFVCSLHRMHPPTDVAKRQAELQRQRTEGDWRLLSDPVDTDAVDGGRMPEQYDSKVRRAVRAFVEAGFDVAAVPNVQVATLQSSISALGLQNVVYAETRRDETILRRIHGGEAVAR